MAGANQTKSLPLPYSPAFEKPEADEAKTIQELMKTMSKIREKTYMDTGCPMRSVHAKSHGLLQGEFRVVDNLPAYLAQGLFSMSGRYPVIMRLSSTPGDILPDSVSTPRGCAIKVVGVKGPRLSGTEEDVTQDFVMVNGGPAFLVADLKKFSGNIKLLAATTDKAEGAKVAISTVLQGIEKIVESAGGTSAKIRSMGGEPANHILGETFFTQAPILFGAYMAKLSLVPVSPELLALKNLPMKKDDNPLAIRHTVIDFFQKHGGEWELRAQLCTDIDTMPIEDASVVWPEDVSPYVTVARLVVPPQLAWSEARSAIIDDGMAFSPWHALAAHRPIGSIMRGRKNVYEDSAKFRASLHGKHMQEPKSLADLPVT